jgi:glycosyltransferase involved in cell wall biosynthesis
MDDDELVTVVVPAANEEGFVGACLDSVTSQDYRNLQIVVVDGASIDATVEIVRARMAADPRIELVRNPRRNIPSSLNLAVDRAKGTWLVRVDAHSTVGPGYVRAAVDRLREGRWAGVGGRKEGVGRTPAGRAIAVAMGSRFGVGNSTYHFGTAVQEVDHLPFGTYPVQLVRSSGGWDERLTANEDYEFDYRVRRAGGRLLFDPSLVIAWQCRQSVPDLFQQYRRYGMGKVDVMCLHPESMSLRHFLPPALVVYAAASVLLGIRHPRVLTAMLPYVVAVGVASAEAAGALQGAAERVRLPAAFVAMHFGWGLGFWSRLAVVAWARCSRAPRSVGLLTGPRSGFLASRPAVYTS